jgi:hypothetical protein
VGSSAVTPPARHRAPASRYRSSHDSLLEGDGFELPVPRTTPGFWPISTRTTRRDISRKKGVRIRQLLAAAGPPGNDLDPPSDNTEKAAKEQVVPIPCERHYHAAIGQRDRSAAPHRVRDPTSRRSAVDCATGFRHDDRFLQSPYSRPRLYRRPPWFGPAFPSSYRAPASSPFRAEV